MGSCSQYFHSSTWTLVDIDDEIKAYVTGKTTLGQNIILTIEGFEPSFAIESDADSQVIENWMQNSISILKNNEWNQIGDAVYFYKEETVVSAWGYQGSKKTMLYTFRCKTLAIHRRIISQLNYRREYFLHLAGRKRFPGKSYTLFSIQDPLHEICLVSNTTPQGWIDFTTQDEIRETEEGILHASCDITDVKTYTLQNNDPIYAPKCRLFFDLETYSSRQNTMECDPTLKADVIFMIAVTIETPQDQITQLLYLYPSNSNDGIGSTKNKLSDHLAVLDNYEQVGFKKLSNMLLYFANLFKKYRPSETYGFNTGQFDWNYLFQQVRLHGIEQTFCEKLSLLGEMEGIGIPSLPCRLEDRRTVSKQKGEQIFQVLICPGVVDIDILPFIRDQPNSNKDKYLDYKLSTVYEIELKAKMKKEMSYTRIYDAWRNKNLEDLALIAEYAVYDTRPLVSLVNQVAIYERLAGVSSIAAIPIDHVLYRGISLLCYNVLYKKATSIGYAIPYRPIKPGDDEGNNDNNLDVVDPFSVGEIVRDDYLYEEDDERIEVKYEGATVLDVVTGIHVQPVATLDFTSLYPSNMTEHNLCYTSIILQNDPDVIEYANMVDGGITIQEWTVPRIKCHISDIQYENSETAIEGILRGMTQYKDIRERSSRLLNSAFELLYMQDNLADSEEQVAELEKEFWLSLGSSVQPIHATSNNLASMMRKVQAKCTKLQSAARQSSRKRPYIAMKENCSKMMSAITKHRKDAKKVVDKMEIIMAPKSAMIVEGAAKLLPSIQKNLTLTRNYWKKEMKKVEKGSPRYKAADSAQLGAKLIMNSLYGFAGSKFPLPMTIIAELTTAIGRRNIKTTKDFCETIFSDLATNELVWSNEHEKKWPTVAKQGRELWNARERGVLQIQVIGGDTDSVFAKFYGCTILETIALSNVMANECTRRNFKAPSNLEYEKVSCPCVIIARKNRSEYVYEKDDQEKNLKHKGNFMVKRIYCRFLKDLGEKMIKHVQDLAPIQNPIDCRREPEILAPAQATILLILQEELWRLYRGMVSWEDLCVSAAFSSKVGEKTVVGRLANKLKMRHDPQFRISERFRMVYVDTKSIAKYCNMNVAAVDVTFCSEKLDFITEHQDITSKWTPHGIWYLNHIHKPILSLSKVLTIPDQVEHNNVFLAQVVKMLRNFEVVAEQKSKAQSTITSFFGIGIPKEPNWTRVEALDEESKSELYLKDKIWFDYMMKLDRSLDKSKIK